MQINLVIDILFLKYDPLPDLWSVEKRYPESLLLKKEFWFCPIQILVLEMYANLGMFT